VASLFAYPHTKGLLPESGSPFYFREVNYEREATMPVTIRCAVCGAPIEICTSHVPKRSTCSKTCRTAWQRKFEIDPGELLLAVWTKPVTSVAASFDVSDKAIEKRCKRLGVVKPPRGYWAKVQNGASHEQALLALCWKKEKIEKLGENLVAAKDSVLTQETVPIPD
jgi:hypothetical protein